MFVIFFYLFLAEFWDCWWNDDHGIEIIEKDVLDHKIDTNFVETLPFQYQHSDLGIFSTGPYRPLLNVS